jgi:Transposase IS66 family
LAHDSRAAGSDRVVGFRSAVAGGDRDVDRAQPDLAAGIQRAAGEMFGVRLSTGSVDAICQDASDALAGPYRQLRDWICQQEALHTDKTAWRTAGDPRALWTLTSQQAAIFQIAEHCNREQFNKLIGAFARIVISDRWPGYEHPNPDRRQVCWSHLQRDFRRHADWSRRAEDLRRSRPTAHRSPL